MKKKPNHEILFFSCKRRKILLTMKLLLCFILFSMLNVSGSIFSQSATFDLAVNGRTVKEVFKEIESQSNFRFLYNDDFVGLHRVVSFNTKDNNIDEVLGKLLAGAHLTYRELENELIVITPMEVMRQENVVTGQVTDADTGIPLPGVTIMIRGTQIGTVTDVNGHYTLKIPDDVDAEYLVFSYIGMDPRTILIEGMESIDIALTPTMVALDEVVAIGYGTQRRRDITGSVTSITGDDITDVPISRMDEALIGRVPGLDVVSTGNNPGDGTQILLRGRRSFEASNEPLFILDGLPFYGNLGDINPHDIVSVDVLKDASATSIYGSRGANGVVIITTQRGEIGTPRFRLESYVGPKLHVGRIPYGDANYHAAYKREANRTAGNYPDPGINDELDQVVFEPEEYNNLQTGTSYDYPEMLFQNGTQMKHQLSVDGGTEVVKYNIAGNTYNEEGIISGLTFDRYSLRTNIDISPSGQNEMNFGVSTLLTYSLRHRDSNLGAIGRSFNNSPLGQAFNEDGSLRFTPITGESLAGNPLADYEWDSYRWDDERWAGYISMYGDYKIFPTLTYRINIGADINVQNRKESAGFYSISRNMGAPSANLVSWRNNRLIYESILTFDKIFNDIHNITITGIHGVQTSNLQSASIYVTDVPYEPSRYHNVGSAGIINSVGSNLQEWSLLSYAGRVNYGYDNRYLLTLTMRADGASQFSPDHKWGYFPSAAFAWRISEEGFMSEVTWLHNLKLRLSYGVSGNQAISPYQAQGGLSSTTYSFGETGAFGYRPSELANRDLRWESTAVQNIGLDFGLLGGRISGYIDMYNTDTYDLLMFRMLPSNTGYTSVIENVGNTNNKGLEIQLHTVNLSEGNLRWNTDFTFYRNRERIVELYGGKVDDVGSRWFIGEPINVFYDFKKIGIWQTGEADEAAQYNRKPGEIKLFDVNGDGQYTDADRMVLGSPETDFVMNITNRFSYNNWDFSFIGYLRWGGMASVESFQLDAFSRSNQLMLDYWTPENPVNTNPRPNEGRGSQGHYNGSTLRYRDASLFRLRQVSLGYRIPDILLNRASISDAKIYVTGENLWYWTKSELAEFNIEPESHTGHIPLYPALRTIILGLNISF